MNINILAVGKVKEKYILMGIEEFAKRLTPHCNIKIIEVPDEPAPEKLSESEEQRVKQKEGEKLLKYVSNSDYTIALDLKGKTLSSEEFAEKISDITMQASTINFIIGGSLGLSSEVLNACQYKLSFSKMTFPHQLMRLILIEQIYRGFRIINGYPYHK